LVGSRLVPGAVVSSGEVEHAVAQAFQAQQRWKGLSVKQRKDRLKKMRDAFIEASERFASVMLREQGMSSVEAYNEETVPVLDMWDYWLKHAEALFSPVQESSWWSYTGFKEVSTQAVPKGVVGLVAGSESPLFRPMGVVVPALLAGNSVVFKPSETTARVGIEIEKLCGVLDVPHVVQVLQGGAEVGTRLLQQRLDHVVFMGSAHVAKKAARMCAESLTSFSARVRGHNSAVVCVDADLERAARGVVWGAFAGAGQHASRLDVCYVADSVYEVFLERVVHHAQALGVREGESSVFDVAPLLCLEDVRLTERHVRDALNKGAQIVCGGVLRESGFFFEPTVLTHVTAQMDIAHEPVSGPLLVVQKFKDMSEVVKQTEKTPQHKSVSLWTQDVVYAKQWAAQVWADVVCVNNQPLDAVWPQALYGGVRGRKKRTLLAAWSAAEFVLPKTLLVDTHIQHDVRWFPYTSQWAECMRVFVLFRGNKKFFIRLLRSLLDVWKKRSR
jgi:acyl-CoA reductase-like NAD-dependent aldehyde dehydrogenase